jgi:hypothetical protein
MEKTLLFKDAAALKKRDAKFKDLDKSALYAIVQAAVNVELFTIPLYMTSLYSIQGLHQITGNNNFYQGRLWPGMSTKVDAASPNGQAFNAVFSVFIAEMLHLQLISNVCKAVGYSPVYTGDALQNKNFGWTCYGDDLTILPHILDFKDTDEKHEHIKVKLGALNKEQVELFLAIEETEDLANHIIVRNKEKYVSTVPFANWKQDSTSSDLPLFASIGGMYLRLWEYLSIEYSDHTTLWDYVFTKKSVQQDLFNSTAGGHEAEYPHMNATIPSNNSEVALEQVLDMINGITDQGEGGGVVAEILKRSGKPMVLKKVQHQYRPSNAAMKANYPNYSDTGKPEPSKDAYARHHYGAKDHYEIFADVMELLDKGGITTWDQWHAAGNVWTEEMLRTEGYEKNTHPIPDAKDIAGALNRLKQTDTQSNYTKFSHTAAGAIAGVTRVLNDYFNNPNGAFPYPSMSGSGDRMSICWAIFGKAPDLALGILPKTNGVLYHACQGLNLDPSQKEEVNNCAAVEVFHTCRGSNDCKAEGGCGFVQSTQGGASSCGSSGGGGSCSAKASFSFPGKLGYKAPAESGKVQAGCGAPQFYSAPSDNKCNTFGGCAIPISASQIFPTPAAVLDMELNDFVGADFNSVPFGKLAYQEGELVYDVAWKAYCEVLAHRGKPVPAERPKPSDIRLAFPPST